MRLIRTIVSTMIQLQELQPSKHKNSLLTPFLRSTLSVIITTLWYMESREQRVTQRDLPWYLEPPDDESVEAYLAQRDNIHNEQ